MNEKRIIEVLEMIAKDMEDDAKNFDGRPFTGRMVAEYFGYHGAAIAKIADIVKLLVESSPTLFAVQCVTEQTPDVEEGGINELFAYKKA